MTKRVPDNTNLRLWSQPFYRGLPVMGNYQLVEEYLEDLWDTIQLSIQEYPRVFAVRLDLRSSVSSDLVHSNDVMVRFKKALDSRILAYRRRRQRVGKAVHTGRVRMVWAREQDSSRVPHFHVLLLFNRDEFYQLGEFYAPGGSLYRMIEEAWGSALGVRAQYCRGLANATKSATYHLGRSNGYQQRSALFQRASYLCKVDTKCFGQGLHSFGSSRK